MQKHLVKAGITGLGPGQRPARRQRSRAADTIRPVLHRQLVALVRPADPRAHALAHPDEPQRALARGTPRRRRRRPASSPLTRNPDSRRAVGVVLACFARRARGAARGLPVADDSRRVVQLGGAEDLRRARRSPSPWATARSTTMRSSSRLPTRRARSSSPSPSRFPPAITAASRGSSRGSRRVPRRASCGAASSSRAARSRWRSRWRPTASRRLSPRAIPTGSAH